MKEEIPRVLEELPESPGIYRFYSDDVGLFYVGKSKNLRRRVRSPWKFRTLYQMPEELKKPAPLKEDMNFTYKVIPEGYGEGERDIHYRTLKKFFVHRKRWRSFSRFWKER